MQRVLNHAGYTPEISHSMLVEMAEHKKELEKKTKPILDTLRSYQDLPPVFQVLHFFCLLLLWRIVELCFLFILTFSAGGDCPG